MRSWFTLIIVMFFSVPAAAQEINVKIIDDPYNEVVVACSPEQGGRNVWQFETQTTQLCGTILRGEPGPPLVTFTFYHNYEGDWINYSTASLRGGSDLETKVSRSVGRCRSRTIFGGGCSLSESVTIYVPIKQIVSCSKFDLHLKLWGGRPIELKIAANECAAILNWLKTRSEAVLPQ